MNQADPGDNLPVMAINDKRIAKCSHALALLFGLDHSKDLINRDIEQFFPLTQSNGDSSGTLWNQFLEEAHEKGIMSFPWQFVTASGQILTTNLNAVVHGALMVIIVRPKLSLKSKYSNFEDFEGLLMNINQKIEEGIYRSSMTSGFYYVNRAFVKMFGFKSEAEVLEMDPNDIKLLYEISNAFMELVNKVKEQGFIRNQEVLFKRKDGTRFWGLHSCYLQPDPDGTQFLDGIIVDITHIKESESLMKQKNQELQKVKEEMDRFVYSISHDLRAPLSSVLGLLNLAESERDSKQLALFIGMMKVSIKKLDHFINEILDYTRNARLKLEDDRIDFEQLTSNVIKSIAYMEGFSRIKKSINVYSKSEFVSDQKRITIIMTNLITNAVLYHDPNKKNLSLEINIFIDKEKARIEVVDNGTGIPAKHLDKIFKMFYRASEDSKGSGLGLYMVKECVEKLQGSINVSSTIGVGTKFEILLNNFQSQDEPKAKLVSDRTTL